MTEKRFTITQDFEEHYRQIRDNGKVVMGCFLEPQAEVIVDLLNEQHEELGNRKRIIKTITNEYNELEQAKNSLLKKNEKLKQQLKKLQEFKDNYDKNMELIHNSEYVQDFLNGNL